MVQEFEQLRKVMSVVSDLGAASAVLGWDQETYMPDGAVSARAEQLATIAELHHFYLTNEDAQRAVASAKRVSSDFEEIDNKVLATFSRDHERALKLPKEYVVEMAKTASLAQDAWKKARATNSFETFRPLLQRIVELKQQEASILDAKAAHPYDVMLDTYEPGLTINELNPVFDELQQGTAQLLSQITPLQDSVDDSVLYQGYPVNEQLTFSTDIIKQLGFDMNTGRVDLSAHPFCTHFAHSDVRLTTRIRENDLRSCLFGLIHEAGHGMYEQGVSPRLARTPAAEGASMGIHESQSLFWENIIARSEEFWSWAFPRLSNQFPDQLKAQNVQTFFRAINKMKPSLNRVESDELTYNLHIILRFEIERDLMDGTLAVADVPEAWKSKMESALGVVPDTDAEGCLQDVHWSFGGIGYFPSYSLGKLYAAMLWNSIQEQLPNVKNNIANGEFEPIVQWLRQNIHQHGRTETPKEIINRVCDRALTHQDFIDYIGAKAKTVYGF